MTNHIQTPNIIPWPPIILICAFAIGIILNGIYPLSTPFGVIGELLFGLGIMLVVIALLIDVAAMQTMRKAKTTIMPNKTSANLVTTGIFAFSRNPIYIANAMILFGCGLVFGNLWLCIIMPFSSYMTQKLAIEREEEHLEARFGSSYRSYKKKVSRWI